MKIKSLFFSILLMGAFTLTAQEEAKMLRFVNKRVTNMGSNPTNLLDLRRVKIGE